MLSPDSTIGILGGGQLGRMLALAAARLGFKCHVFAPSPDAAAFDVVHRVTCADYADNAALDRFAADVDVITYEFENVPAQTATFLSARTSVLPDPQVLAITQDRLTEKNFITGLGIATARFAEICSPAELASALGATGARLMTTLLHELERTGGRFGLQTMCEGGGQANVTIIERL